MKKGILIFLVVFNIAMVGCNKPSTQKVLSQNVSRDIKEEVSEVKQLLIKGKKALDEDDYVNAKIFYDKAMELDKSNKDIYLEIKNQYVSKERYGDAYCTIKKALDNKIDEDDMTNIVNEIKSHFNIIIINDQVYVNGSYELPSKTEVDVDGENIMMNINWNGQVADLSKEGMHKYEGYNDQYGRSFILNLSVAKREQADSSKDTNKDNSKEVSESAKREYRDVSGDAAKQISEEEVKSLIINGVNTFADIVGPENINTQNLFKPDGEDGRDYSECTKYTTTEAIVDALRPYYTEECINRFINKYVLVKDGKTYITVGDIGSIVNNDYNFKIGYGQDLIEVTATYDYGDWQVHRDYVIANTGNGWRMNKIAEIE